MKIKLSTWNVNGIRAILKKPDLSSYLSKSSPDILCLNETRIDEEKLVNSEIKASFSCFPFQLWSCHFKKGYSGVAILSRFKPLKTFTFFPNDIPYEKKEIQGRLAIMEFLNFFLVAVYSPNTGSELRNMEFRTETWEKYLRNSLSLLLKPIILCGDLNVSWAEIDLYNPKGNRNNPGFTDQERNCFGLLLKDGFSDCFRRKYPLDVKYTWWSTRHKMARKENKGWRIDHFLIKGENEKFKAEDCIIRDEILGSDHCPVELMVEMQNSII